MLKLYGFESINQSFYFKVTFISNSAKTFEQFLLHDIKLHIGKRTISGTITSTSSAIASQNLDEDLQLLITFTIEPYLALAKLSMQPRVILNSTIPQIIETVLIRHNYQKNNITLILNRTYQQEPMIIQLPNENDYQFLLRLCDTYKIFFYCTENRIVFKDNIPIENNPIRKSLTTNNSKLTIFDKKHNNDYIYSVEHHAEQNIEHHTIYTNYKNKVRFACIKDLFTYYQIKPTSIPIFLTAHIESQHQYPFLNNQGYYQLRFAFDLSEQPIAEASPAIGRIQPALNWHTPLADGAEVLISFLYNDLTKPLIIGTIHNSTNQAIITSYNPQQNILRTKSGNEILIDDSKDNQQIKISNDSYHNSITLNNKANQKSIDISSNYGAINIFAQQRIKLKSKSNVKFHAANGYKITSKHAFYQAVKGNINVISANKLTIKSKNNITLKSNKNLAINAQKNFKLINRHGNSSFKTNNGITKIISKESNIIMQAKGGIIIKSNGTKTILIKQQNSGIKITPDGTVELFGDELKIESKQGINIKGKAHYLQHK
ncbi:MAG: hypothetical protein JXR42_06430 [Gammaproteobacteria bacterium]|nr:hypothetical protein [Gammaproteobacteria bacterium]